MAAERSRSRIIIGGKEIRTGRTEKTVMPHDHQHVLAEYHLAGPEHVQQAIAASAAARREWAAWAWEDRAAVILRAAELLATSWRPTINAATMLGQSKTAMQAEIDAASEMIDFWRFNTYFAQELYHEQPMSSPGMWNQMEYRGARGLRLRHHAVQLHRDWRQPDDRARDHGQHRDLEAGRRGDAERHYTMRLLEAAGMPPGVINFLPGDAVQITQQLLDSPELAGIHFTGSTAVFNSMWKRVGENIGRYRSYPRLVGETGGKDFIVVHASADPQEVAVAIARGGFEYQGQKCSAASRIYVPQSIWGDVRDRTIAMMKDIRMGDVRDFRNFMGAVIDKKAFTRISEYLDDARKNAKVLQGGTAKGDTGYFVEPTLDRDVRSRVPPALRGNLRPRRHGARVSGRQVGGDAGDRRQDIAVRPHGSGVRPRSRAPSGRPRARCATPPATSTSTTSPQARSSASSRSAARARRARTTRPARS